MWNALVLIALVFLAWFTISTVRYNTRWERRHGETLKALSFQPRLVNGQSGEHADDAVVNDAADAAGASWDRTGRYARTGCPRPVATSHGQFFDWKADPDLASDDR